MHPPALRRSLLATIVVLALAPAVAAAAWLPSSTLGETTLTPQSASPAIAAAGPDGHGVTAWRTAAPGAAPGQFRLMVSPFDAAGAVTPTPLGPDGPIGAPQVAAGHDGTRAVVWSRAGEGVRAVVISPDGTVGPVQELAGAGTSAPLVDVDAGRVTVVYLRTADGATGVEYVRFAPGGPVLPPFVLATPNPNAPAPISDLRLARAPGGEIVAVWRHRLDSDPSPARYQVRAGLIRVIGPPFADRQVSASDQNAGQPAVAPAPQGGFRVVWPERPPGATGGWSVRLATLLAGSGFAVAADEVAPEAPSQNIVDIATLPSGASLVLHSVPLADGSLRGRIIAPDGTLAPGAPTEPLPPGAGIPSVDGFDLAAGADGLFTLAWADAPVAGDTTLRVRRLDALGVPQAVTDLDPPDATDPRLAVTAAGSVTAVWLRDPGSGDRQVRSAHFDIEGPVLSLAPPAPAAAGQPVTLTAMARDRAQPITYLWSLGDGSPAFSAGASVAPVYGRPGDYPVQVTATDSLGRATVASTTVTVVPPAPGIPLVCAPAQPPVIAPGRVRITLTAAQLRINQRISQAAVRRVSALQARVDGRPAPEDPPRGEPGRVTLTVAQLRINQRISQAALRRVNALSARVQGLPEPTPAGSTPGRLTLSTGQLLTNQRIGQAAVRRVNALALCLDAAGR